MWDLGCALATILFFWIAARYVDGCARLSTDKEANAPNQRGDQSAGGATNG